MLNPGGLRIVANHESAATDEFIPQTVVALAWAKDEAREVLNPEQYATTVEIVKRLADFGNQKETADLDIAPFGKFWELKLKGGYLRKINFRAYFAHLADRAEVVILKSYKKEEERRVSPHIMHTLEDRLEQYLAGKCVGSSTFDRSESGDSAN
jgi:hypothetical protein